MPPLLMRSKLFVPATHGPRLAKALATAADQVAIDLEDSVTDADKPAARRSLRAFLRSDAAAAHAQRLVVRLNAAASAGFDEDAAALAGGACTLVNLPKVESGDDVLAALAAIDAARGDAAVRVLCTVESPRGLRRAHAIAAASARVAGLQLGLADLFEPAGIDRSDAANVHAAMFALAMAAAEARVPVFDAVFPAIDDEAGFRAEARRARALGYAGKSCIHPRQVAWANDAFTPAAAEIARARRIVEQALRHGGGAFALDGKMIDRPFVERAQALIERFGGGAADASSGEPAR